MNFALNLREDDATYKSITANTVQQSFNLNATSDLITARTVYKLYLSSFYRLLPLRFLWMCTYESQYSINSDVTLFTLNIEPLGISMAP